MTDLELLIRDKYAGDASRVTKEDGDRLARGEPLAYVIGWVPFLGHHIALDSKPLIPRPETEWWTELLIERVRERRGATLRALDLCAGSGAIGIALLAAFPGMAVSFGELSPEHARLIERNIRENGVNASLAQVRAGDLFEPFEGDSFDIIATNPPYIPAGRPLDASVAGFEPQEALFSGDDGLGVIRRIATEAPRHLNPGGELWIECDTENIHETARLLTGGGALRADIRTDLYGRERLVLAYY